MRIKLTINKAGVFTGTNHTRWQCNHTGHTYYQYEVRLSCWSDQLQTENGFIIDNAQIQQYFEEAYTMGKKPLVSCERLAIDALKDLVRLCKSQGVTIIDAYVKIVGSNQAFMEARWRRPRSDTRASEQKLPGYRTSVRHRRGVPT